MANRHWKLWAGALGAALLLSPGCASESLEGVYHVPDDLYAVTAVGEDHMWAAGYFGAIYHTKDGGQSWEKLRAPTQKSVYDINFADTRHGWAVGRRGFVVHTRDGGETWARQEIPRKPAHHIFSIFSIDQNRVWAVGDWGGRYYSADGGETWQDRSFLLSEDHPAFKYLTDAELEAYERGEPLYDDIYLNDVFFIDPQKGWIVGEYGYIYRTTNGGETWDKMQIVGAVSFDDIKFASFESEIPRVLWPPLFEAAAILNEKEYLRLRIEACLTAAEFLKTGETTLADERAESLRDFLESEGISQDRIRLVNPTPFDEEDIDMDAFRKSKLCDKPHVSVEVVETPFLFDIKMNPDQTGLIAGLGGVILYTGDDGVTWRYAASDSRQAFFAVGIGANRMVAVGEKGLRRISRDGGVTWQPPEQGFPPVVRFMRDLVFGSERRGWIVGAGTMILRSSDGGLTWEDVKENIQRDTVGGVDHAAGE